VHIVKVVLAGGSGSLGRRIAADLAARGNDIVVLTRQQITSNEHQLFRPVHWDGLHVGSWASELSGAAVINLAGLLVDRGPTAKNVELRTPHLTPPSFSLSNVALCATFDSQNGGISRRQ
jgi:nucleoside-diphosphate-sugar epimerase